jgi:hypothetical protein
MKIAFLGGGNMASALLAGVLSSGVAGKDEVEVVEISAERRAWLAEKFGVAAVPDGAAAVAASDIAVLAVKPQNAPELLAELADALGPDKLLLSIAAGLSTATLERAVAARVVRAMPNLAATVGKAVSALCAGTRATAEDLDAAARRGRNGARRRTDDGRGDGGERERTGVPFPLHRGDGRGGPRGRVRRGRRAEARRVDRVRRGRDGHRKR